jgi:benzoate membrane transport protein
MPSPARRLEPVSREAALITILASAANINMLGVGRVFWGW